MKLQEAIDGKSISDLEELVSKDQSNAFYIIALGYKYLSTNRWDKVAECITQAVEANDLRPELLELSIAFECEKGDYTSAILLAEKLATIKCNPEVLLKIVFFNKKIGDYAKALQKASEGVSQYPHSIELLWEKCSLLRILGNTDECENCFKTLIVMTPNVVTYMWHYGEFLREQGRAQEAKNIFEQLLQSGNLSQELHEKAKQFLQEKNVNPLYFQAQARLLVQLGEQMIENEAVALSELVKNAYDARSPFVEIDVNTGYAEFQQKIGKIEIFDIGKGMTKNDVETKWLVLSTDHKKHEKNEGQLPLGEKGIGRLSAHRLGQKLRLETSVIGENSKTIVEVDWDFFEYGSRPTLDGAKVILSEANEDTDKAYTRLIITRLRNPDFWTKAAIDEKKLDAFKDSVFSLMAPFSSLSKIFTLKLTLDGKKMLIEAIDEEYLDIVSTSKLKLHFEFDDQKNMWAAQHEVILYPDFYYLKSRRLLKDIEKISSDKKWKNKFYQLAALTNEPKSFSERTYQNDLIKSIKNVWEINLLGFRSPGSFQMVIFSFSRDKEILDRINERIADIYTKDANKQISKRYFFDRIKGIKVYRDSFRVFPYGEDGNDWLQLDQSASTYGTFDDIKSANSTGYIRISSLNQQLREKTNREGFIEDAFSRTFYAICGFGVKALNDVLRRETDRLRKIRDGIINEIEIEIKEKKLEEDQKRSEAEKKFSAYLSTEEEHPASEVAKAATKYFNHVEASANIATTEAIIANTKLELIEEELQKVAELASFGMLIEAFTHEFERQLVKLRDDMTYLLSLNNLPESIRKRIENMSLTIRVVDGYTKHLVPSYQKERKRRIRLDLVSLIHEIFSEKTGGFIYDRATRQRIKIVINQYGTEKFIILGNQGLLTQIFDNLYLNAEYWLNDWCERGEIPEKIFTIELDTDHKKVYVYDNGPGIDPKIRDTLFYAFETMKPPGEGRGLGLYITKSILELLRGKITLDDRLNKYGNAYQFMLDFSQNG